MDDVDRAYTDSLVPEGAIVTSLLSVVGWINADGTPDWRLHVTGNETLVTHLGMLDLTRDKLKDLTQHG